MAGQPGRSGGQRAGAGRPVQSVRLKANDQWITQECTADGRAVGTLRLGTVVLVGRSRIEIVLDDGARLVLYK